ncbi:MAG: 16S rRNA (guanine(527)-N(7))-methyltransferase RsmG [Candidatus Cloacimonetes bacterium]|nr:16S rRNA (guanine(527)-N(7))-methyltransferase RsmG [Candidatus Cloacimonadota bacterium]
MSVERDIFQKYLRELRLAEPEALLESFDLYHSLLLEANAGLNLFSRATPPSELWTKHFLDSLLPLNCVDFTGKNVLDFGTGGGLPGIPIKLAVLQCRMTLLDSTRKKILAVEKMIAKLELTDCKTVCSRLEDFRGESFDLILCRAVKLEERYHASLRRLLKPNGQLIIYKAREIADIEALKPRQLLRVELHHGTRAIFTLSRNSLKK